MTKLKLLLLTTALPLSCSLVSCDDNKKSNSSVTAAETEASATDDETTAPATGGETTGDETTEPITRGITIGKVGTIDPALQPYLDTFIKEANDRGHDLMLFNLNMEFKKLDDGVLGVCGHDAVAAYVDISETLKSGDPEFTVLHELGHCLLGMEHREVELSIMNAFEADAELRAVDRKKLFDELFQEKYFFPVSPQ